MDATFLNSQLLWEVPKQKGVEEKAALWNPFSALRCDGKSLLQADFTSKIKTEINALKKNDGSANIRLKKLQQFSAVGG